MKTAYVHSIIPSLLEQLAPLIYNSAWTTVTLPELVNRLISSLLSSVRLRLAISHPPISVSACALPFLSCTTNCPASKSPTGLGFPRYAFGKLPCRRYASEFLSRT